MESRLESWRIRARRGELAPDAWPALLEDFRRAGRSREGWVLVEAMQPPLGPPHPAYLELRWHHDGFLGDSRVQYPSGVERLIAAPDASWVALQAGDRLELRQASDGRLRSRDPVTAPLSLWLGADGRGRPAALLRGRRDHLRLEELGDPGGEPVRGRAPRFAVVLDVAPDPGWVATWERGQVRLRGLVPGRGPSVDRLLVRTPRVPTLAFAPGGRRLALVTRGLLEEVAPGVFLEDELALLEVEGGGVLARAPLEYGCRSLTWSPDGSRLALILEGGGQSLVRVLSGEDLSQEFAGETGASHVASPGWTGPEELSCLGWWAAREAPRRGWGVQWLERLRGVGEPIPRAWIRVRGPRGAWVVEELPPEMLAGPVAAAWVPGPDPELVLSEKGSLQALGPGARRRWGRDPSRPVVATRVSRDGRRVLLVDAGGGGRVLETRAGSPLWNCRGATPSAGWLGEGERVLLPTRDGFRILAGADGEVLLEVNLRVTPGFEEGWRLAPDPAGEHLLCAGGHGLLQLRDAVRGQVRWEVRKGRAPAERIGFLPGRQLFEVRTGELRIRTLAGGDLVLAQRVGPEVRGFPWRDPVLLPGTALLLGRRVEQVPILDLPRRARYHLEALDLLSLRVRDLLPGRAGVRRYRLSPSGERVALTRRGRSSIEVVELATGAHLVHVPREGEEPRDFAFAGRSAWWSVEWGTPGW